MSHALPARVVVVSGLHAAARAHAVEELLRAVPGALAVHHDLGEVSQGTVRRVLRDRWGERDRSRVDLVHACVSCTLREDLVPLLVELAERGEDRLFVVESWDGVEPRQIAEALALTTVSGRPVSTWLRVAAVVTAVAAERVVADLATTDDMVDRRLAVASEDDRTVAEVFARQLEYPTALAVHGADGDPAVRQRCTAVLSQLNPAAVVVPAEGGALLPLVAGHFDVAAAAARTDPATAQPPERCEAGEVRTVTWRRSRPLHPARLHAALDDVVAASLRSRGRFWLASHPDTMLVWDAAGSALAMEPAGPWLAALPDAAWDLVSEQRRAAADLDWTPGSGDRCQCLSFTGVGLDVDRLVGVLDSCLLTEAEMAGDPRRWTRAEDPFAEVLDRAP
ncbi:CobW family GTP-binding protein [Marinitenerispora sediminis]|uniref:Cobalamin biosynthesis protein CobW n=1 Tax=Marinitenerispora sediminis TaxID=1931232 RepID=A0A368SZF1_9ACTN|nr:GTP-binding protein [Marinitenerispora sediminis]RCV51268.1 cobalamin biosynthesis protein CobW [Marinitenerispora sediminis]RCV52130.1 cobalamin biosynthesis protein CobW [Marinitenerispora sediminis]RCV57818.1 cobalamin biosynthesis protein CobW [Marinitenerispora sediminis]